MTLPHITQKQFTILKLIYRFRFLDRKQIQIMLSHKDHGLINIWLKDLVLKQCIQRIYSKKMPENTKPAVYFLGRNGRKILQKHDPEEFTTAQLRKSYRDSARSAVFRIQCLALVDCYVTFKKYTSEKGFTWTFYTRDLCCEYDVLNELSPDGFVSVTKKNGRSIEYALFLITHRIPRRFTRYKLQHLVNFFINDGWDTKTYPSIFVICSNRVMESYANNVLENKLAQYEFPEKLQINCCVFEDFKTHGIEGEIWIQPKRKEEY